jgi:xylitol oxidase
MEIVLASGDVVSATREQQGEHFMGAVVGLGGVGIVTKVTLEVQPTFDVSQIVYENMPLNHLEHHFDEIFGAGYSVSLFSDWQNHKATQVWIKRRMDQNGGEKPVPEFFGATLAKQKLHPLSGHSAENCTEQMGIPGPWHERLPHFRMNFTPSSGAELQTEYFVPRDKAYQAILAVEQLKDQITPHLFITELRTIEGDNLWISEAYRRPAMAIHFTWKPEWPEVKGILPAIEAKLAPFDARPHWAKLFTMAPEQIQARYSKMGEFKELLNEHDPKGKFRNEFLSRNLYS